MTERSILEEARCAHDEDEVTGLYRSLWLLAMQAGGTLRLSARSARQYPGDAHAMLTHFEDQATGDFVIKAREVD